MHYPQEQACAWDWGVVCQQLLQLQVFCWDVAPENWQLVVSTRHQIILSAVAFDRVSLRIQKQVQQ